MSKPDYKAWMFDAGWRYTALEGGGYYSIGLSHRTLIAFPTFSQLPDRFIFWDEAGVRFERYARAKNFVFPGIHATAIRVVDRWRSKFEKEGRGTPEFVEEATAELKTWAMTVDEDAEIRNHTQERPVYGLYSFDLVPALALLGRTAALEGYAAEVAEKGKAETLHSLMTADVFDRALRLARAVSGGADALTWLDQQAAVDRRRRGL